LNTFGRSLLHASVLYCCAAAVLAAALVGSLLLLLWLSGPSTLAVVVSLAGPVFLVALLPWLGLAYIFASSRFPVRWNWFVSTIAALAATQGVRLLPVNLGASFAGQIRAVCSYSPGEIVGQSSFLVCAGTAWSALVQGAIIYAAAAGAILLAAVWALRHFLPRRA
jgi:hypothetical protein